MRRALLRVTDQRSGGEAVFSTLAPQVSPPSDSWGDEVFCRICGRKGTLIDPYTG